MTITEAIQNIGQPFTVKIPGFRWDVIRSVNQHTGDIAGDFIEAPADDCRLKQLQPEGLKKYLQSKKQSS